MSPIAVKEYFYTVFFELTKPGKYMITVPVFADLEIECECKSRDEAKEIARYALKEYLEVLTKHNQPIPEEEISLQKKPTPAGFTERIGVYLFTEVPKAGSQTNT